MVEIAFATLNSQFFFFFLTSEGGGGKELRHHCRQRCAHRGERGKRLMPSFAATVARSLWLYVSEEPPRCLLEPHEFHIEAPWATHERKERKKKRPTLSRSRRPSLVALSLCFFFFFTLLPIKNKLDETRSKNLRGGKNGDLLCFSNKITSHESSAPYLLEKKKKSLAKVACWEKKKKGRRNTGLEIRYFSCPSLFFPSLSQSHTFLQNPTHM